MYSAPLAGARVALIADGDRGFPARLTEIVEQERISIWNSVPSAIVRMTRYGAMDERDMTSLRWVKYGGEVFPIDDLREAMRRLPHVRFSNVYGPAEVNQCTFHHMDAEPPGEATEVPLGRAWANTTALVDVSDSDAPEANSDSAADLRSQGDGELCIATDTRMMGYLGRPDLTRSKLIDLGEQVYYRTGDLATIDHEGIIWFRGRKDHQVKTRGYRVELEAVDAAIVGFPGIEEAAAYVEGTGAVSTISAVVVLGPGVRADPDSIRSYLRGRLPPYAVPTRLQFVPEIPRNSNGKIRRQGLHELANDSEHAGSSD